MSWTGPSNTTVYPSDWIKAAALTASVSPLIFLLWIGG